MDSTFFQAVDLGDFPFSTHFPPELHVGFRMPASSGKLTDIEQAIGSMYLCMVYLPTFG